MPERKVYHVEPSRDREGWDIKEQGAMKPESHHQRKQEAVLVARKMAKSHPLGQVVIHKADGSVEEERTYGRDPDRSHG